MKPTPGDTTCTFLDGDACVEAELDIASHLRGGGALDDAPARLFLHLLACPLCLETALGSMDEPVDVERLVRRLRHERAILGAPPSFRRSH